MSLLFAAALAAAAPDACPAGNLRGASVEHTQQAWLERFNALDLPCFLRFFAKDATMFAPFPANGSARRIEQEGISRFWQQEVFEPARKDGRTRLNVQPREVNIVRLGSHGALSSFHLSSDAYPNRRTLVWRRDPEGWRIVHLHASRLAPEPTVK